MKTITASLGEITKIIGGTTPESTISKYWNGQIVWITPTDLGKNQALYLSGSERKITEEGRKSCNLKKVPKGAVVMSSRAPIGHLAIAGCELYTNQGCKSFAPINNILDSEFLYFLLKHRMPDIQARGSGATFLEVSKTALENFVITFPENLTVQCRIVTQLKAQLAEVETARKALAAQQADIKLLAATALDKLYSYSIKNKLGDVAKIQSGYAFKSKDFITQGIKLLRNTNILPNKIYWDDTAYLPSESFAHYPNYVIHEGDVILSLDRPIISTGIKVACISEKDIPALLVQRVGRFLIDKNRLDPSYLYFFLNTSFFKDAISGHEQSLGVPHISLMLRKTQQTSYH
ncbi:MAG: restriction endonuclease subunit S [Methylobacter sp.]|uniref:Restriction endonuclease subunit S n=1 Tax=Candidatus Methylobacter titanis TaxID=3053457 RepID=A0AA43TMQ1_9GAMM|nr:restriction endonuclease subunit S [Candidatus Methylobacter titanis]